MQKVTLLKNGGKLYSFRTSEVRTRLDKLLSEAFPELSRNRLKTLIQAGNVDINGKTITEASYRVKSLSNISLKLEPAKKLTTMEAQNIELDIRYEDSDLIVVNKPPGLVVHPAPGNPDYTLVNGLLAHCGSSLSGIGGIQRPGIVHRLDKDTSGLLIAAKNDRTHINLSEQFQQRTLDRIYIALVWGSPSPAKGVIVGNIGRNPRNRKKMSVLERGGRSAKTFYQVREHLADSCWSLIECHLKTGRTHQIRVHMSTKGHPLVGDPLYGNNRSSLKKNLPATAENGLKSWNRQALHAYSLGFTHPTRHERILLECDPPVDMLELLESGRF